MYDEAIKIEPKYADAYCNKGWIYLIKLLIGNSLYELNRYGEAIKMYDEVIRIDPTYAEAYCNKG